LKTDLLGIPRGELAERLGAYVDRPFRAHQIFDAVHRRGARRFAQITDLGLETRQRLEASFSIEPSSAKTVHTSTDGTRKYLFTLADGKTIETVSIPDRARHTLCLSSQAGCALACRFCVTGFWGAGRNLTAGEIVGQVLAVRFDSQIGALPPALNLVFMGMGEPLLNLDSLRAAVEVLAETISLRRITVSTAGVVPGIAALGAWPKRPNLAVSLHAPDQARRAEIMPISRTYPISDLMAALERYPLEPRRRITFEYILLRDFNDSLSDARALARLVRRVPAKVNLIPANPDPVLGETMVPPDAATVAAFQRELLERDVTATVRRRRGDDVSAACGQLRAQERAPRGFRRSNLSL
jgi:23S rRNA (adenine2503-C2)-methyltransferase